MVKESNMDKICKNIWSSTMIVTVWS